MKLLLFIAFAHIFAFHVIVVLAQSFPKPFLAQARLVEALAVVPWPLITFAQILARVNQCPSRDSRLAPVLSQPSFALVFADRRMC